MENIDFLNTIYQNADMGIVGINEVLYKIKNKKLLKEIKNEKKEYQNIINDCLKFYSKYKEKPKKVSMIAKISSEIYSEIKLINENNDEKIIKMMIEGTYKSIGVLETKKLGYLCCDKAIIDLNNKFINVLNNNINSLKKL